MTVHSPVCVQNFIINKVLPNTLHVVSASIKSADIILDENDWAFAGGIRILNKDAIIHNLSFYADVYTNFNNNLENLIDPDTSDIGMLGFVALIGSVHVDFENIFTELRYSYYTQKDNNTHKAKNAVVKHDVPYFFMDIEAEEGEAECDDVNGIVIENEEDLEKIIYRCSYSFDNWENVYYLKRNEADYPYLFFYMLKTEIKDLNGVEQITPLLSGQEDLVLQYGPNGGNPEDTFTQCDYISDSNCKTIWSPSMKSYTEPSGSKIFVPWLNSNEDLAQN